MITILLVLHIIIIISMIAIILLQRSEGGGFGLSISNILSGRGHASFLTRATTILAGLFFLTSIGLAIISGHVRSSEKGTLGASSATGSRNFIELQQMLKEESRSLKGGNATNPEAPSGSPFKDLQKEIEKESNPKK